MTSLVNASTNKLKCEVERLKAQLEPASASRAEAAAEKERILREKEQLVTEIKGLRKKIVDEEQTCGGRLRSLGSVVAKCTCIATSIVQSVDAFQRHVLPNFRVVEDQKNPEEKSQRINFDSDGSQKLIDEVHIQVPKKCSSDITSHVYSAFKSQVVATKWNVVHFI